MSIYSGFVTRNQEAQYNKALYQLLFLQQVKIYKSLKGEKLDGIIFSRHFCKLYQKLFKMEDQKHLPPKFSYAVKDLAEYFGVYEKVDSNALSSISSNLSFQSNLTAGQRSMVETQRKRSLQSKLRDENSRLLSSKHGMTEKIVELVRKPNSFTPRKKRKLFNKLRQRNSKRNASDSSQTTINNNNIIINISKDCSKKKKKYGELDPIPLTSDEIHTKHPEMADIFSKGHNRLEEIHPPIASAKKQFGDERYGKGQFHTSPSILPKANYTAKNAPFNIQNIYGVQKHKPRIPYTYNDPRNNYQDKRAISTRKMRSTSPMNQILAETKLANNYLVKRMATRPGAGKTTLEPINSINSNSPQITNESFDKNYVRRNQFSSKPFSEVSPQMIHQGRQISKKLNNLKSNTSAYKNPMMKSREKTPLGYVNVKESYSDPKPSLQRTLMRKS